MAKPDDGGPAFPVSLVSFPGMEDHKTNGMSLRDWFAGQVLPALAADAMASGSETVTIRDIAEKAYNFADRMISESKGGAS